MRKVLYGVAALTALAGEAIAQTESPAFDLARQSGMVIGAATACGLSSDRAAVVWKRILAAGTTGANAADDQQFRIVHSEAVRAASLRQQSKNDPGCKRALAGFKLMEDSVTIRR